MRECHEKKWLGVLAACVMFIGMCAQGVLAQPQESAAENKESGEVSVASQSGLVMDAKTQTVLYEKNGERLYYPASITKLLTALVVVKNCSLDETVIFSHDAVYDVEDGSGNNQGFEAGDKLTVEECLYAMILESSNPAANALAEHTSGSMDKFVYEMNETAKELGCRHSSFQNPSGLNDKMQETTAYDMALISCAVFENEALREICSARTYQLSPTLNQPEGYLLQAEHKLINGEETADPQWDFVGGKTGYTSMAGNTLVTYVEEGGRQLVAVVMKSDMTHYEDTRNLLEYGFKNFDALVKVDTEEEDTDEADAAQTSSQTAVSTQNSEQTQKVQTKTGQSLSALKMAGYVTAGAAVVILLVICYLYRKIQKEKRRQERLMRRRRRVQKMRRQQEEEYRLRHRHRRSGS